MLVLFHYLIKVQEWHEFTYYELKRLILNVINV